MQVAYAAGICVMGGPPGYASPRTSVGVQPFPSAVEQGPSPTPITTLGSLRQPSTGKYLARIAWSSVGQLCAAPLLFLISFGLSLSLCPPARGTEDTVPTSPGVQTLCLLWQVLPGAAHAAEGCQSSFLTRGLPYQQQRGDCKKGHGRDSCVSFPVF